MNRSEATQVAVWQTESCMGCIGWWLQWIHVSLREQDWRHRLIIWDYWGLRYVDEVVKYYEYITVR